MAVPSTHRGEMSQDSLGGSSHLKPVTRQVIDPAARTGKRAYNALSASSVGLELGLAVVIGLAVGYYLDQYLGTSPWMLLLWLMLGLAAGFRGVIRAINRADKAAAEEAPLGTLADDASTKETGRG
jgi:ATP synthase protein I